MLCTNHDHVYFDTLRRAYKSETLLSLILATYREKNIETPDVRKAKIASNLKKAYEILLDEPGSYSGDVKQFESQYTIGHELGIWEDSQLYLNPLAISVAENRISVRDYFNQVFLNYFQPVNGVVFHPLYHLLKYMIENQKQKISKSEIKEYIQKLTNSPATDAKQVEGTNSLFNMLIGTNYFLSEKGDTLVFNSDKYCMSNILEKCDIQYLEKGYEIAKEDLNTVKKYSAYLIHDKQGESQKMTTEVKGLNIAPNKDKPKQVILYGVPGAGKSYKIDNELKENNIDKMNTVRVVFHPEYTNADFIGQILPKLTNTGVVYQFAPGPFSQIIRKAYQHPDNNYALIIEEINRGNAAAIFGELFQLLDRLDYDETEEINGVKYTIGWSNYGVNNDYINCYLLGNYDNESTMDKTPVAINFNQNTAIRMPSNLSLFATMNTSDQNVFKLDNAFKRRWDLEMIPNEFDFTCDDEKEQLKQFNQCNAPIEGFDNFTWGAFRAAVNNFIIDPDNGEDNNSFADKQLGTWFVKAVESKDSETGYIVSKNIFMNKVLEYLWDDVFNSEFTIFSPDMKTLAQVIETGNISIFDEKFVTSVNNKKSLIGQFQIETSDEKKENIKSYNIYKKTEYKEFLDYIETFVSTEYKDFELNFNNQQFIGVKKKGTDNNLNGYNFVWFDIIPTKKLFRFCFNVLKSQEIEDSLKVNFPGEYAEEVASKSTMRYRLDLKLNDKDYFDSKKEILRKYMKQAYEDHYGKQ